VTTDHPKEEFAGANIQIPPKVRNILDVGCGEGRFLNSLSDKYEKFGVDFCIEPLKRIGVPCAVGRIEVLPFGSGQFDMVTCFEVLEHLSYYDFENAVLELERVSRKYLAISVPNREALNQSLVSCPYCYCAFNPSWHVRSFNEEILSKIFQNFRMIECSQCGPQTRQHNSKIVSFYRCWKARPPSKLALCPQCGYSKASEINQTKVQYSNNRHKKMDVVRNPTNRIIRFLLETFFIRYVSRPYWLVAIYERI